MGITTFSRNQSKWGGRSDWSRPSISSSTPTTTTTTTTTATETIEPKEEISQIPIPRFSVFGKKAKFESINQKSLEQDNKAAASRKKKFEVHNNNSFSKKSPKIRKKVLFDPIFLERVCLFRESQCPCELKEAHDKRLQNPPFRIICPNWPRQELAGDSNILLNKSSFYVTPDNTAIKGKLFIRNLALDKSVSVRYTFDSWVTCRDVDAVFFGPNPKNVAFDIYEFSMDLEYGQLSDRGEVRGKIEFTIRFTAGENDYLDNNQGSNYKIKVISDPLNDPWAANNDNEKRDEEQEDDEDDLDSEQDEDEEKHSSFTNALKGYKHAKPFHLNKRQPWLGTRYDFGQSLSLAKRAPYDTPTTTNISTPSKPSLYTCSASAPPSPRTSPTLLSSALPSTTTSRPTLYNQSHSTSSILPIVSSSSPLDMNSSYYLDLVNKYCFYNSESSMNDDSISSK
ncbi:putative phosphatase regulatory subunit-domain-containing protein [Thamnidium elegans]|nr:putative phosphatase regulatory subunit-domain-containing protein [Thamnidium elegans]